MANLKTTTSFDPQQYAQLSGALSSGLNNSPTAYTPNTTPTLSDLQQQQSLMNLRIQAEAAQQVKLKQQVYGNQPTPQYDLNNPVPEVQGPVVRGLNALATPLYAIVGGAEALTGTGSKPGLENVFQNVREQGTFGDMLRKVGLNKWAAMPLGFALDVAMDPVNWLTAGTDALIPKLASGLKEGGIEGLTSAARAGALEKVSSLAKFTPLIEDSTRTSLASKAAAAEDVFRTATNKPSVIEEAIIRSQKPGLYGKMLEKTGGSKTMSWLQRNFKYSPSDWLSQSMADEKQIAEEQASGVRSPINQLLQELGGRAELGHPDQISQQLEDLAKSQAYRDSKLAANEAAFNPPARGVLEGMDPADIQKNLKQTAEDINKVRDTAQSEIRANMDETGWQWYDNLIKKVNSNPYGQKLWTAMQNVQGIFKISKVPLNYFTAYTNAAVSNMVMAGMMGVNVTDSRFLDALVQARHLIGGKAISEELAAKISPEIRKLLETYSSTAEGAIGLNQEMIDNSIARLLSIKSGQAITNSWADWENLQKVLSKAKFNADFNPQELQDSFNQLRAEVESTQAGAQQASRGILGGLNKLKIFQKKVEAGAKTAEEVRPALEDMTSFISQDVLQGPIGATLAKWDESGTKAQKFLAGWILKSSQTYNSIDQTYKIGTFFHLTANGVSGPELQRLAKYVPLTAGDVSLVDGLYHLSPEVSMRIANEISMNYAAMPTAIRVLRNMPILGSPFASFAYGMVTKTAKALANNPESLNKVTFLRQEIGRGEPQSPLEKAALGGPYYNYLNRYERMKLPFFQDYPMYLNIANWVPYLSLNIFQTPERKYDNTFGGATAQVIDQLPILKTPEGQALFDYIIQPYVLNEAHPTGQFGQELYPQQGTGLQKTESIATTIAGNYVPNWMPFLGFRSNQFFNAVQGKNSQGVASAQPASSLVLQWLGSMLGAHVTPINLQNVSSGLKKQLSPTKKTTKKN